MAPQLSFSALWFYVQPNYSHQTWDKNTLNFWLTQIIFDFCSDAVFHFSKSKTSDIPNCNAPSIIRKSNRLSCTAIMHIQCTSLWTQSSWNASIHTSVHNLKSQPHNSRYQVSADVLRCTCPPYLLHQRHSYKHKIRMNMHTSDLSSIIAMIKSKSVRWAWYAECTTDKTYTQNFGCKNLRKETTSNG